MNEYLTELRRALPGGAKEREALLARFRAAMAPLEEEIGTPGYDDLVAAFGPPEEMAKTLTASPEGQADVARVKRAGMRRITVLVVAAVCLLTAVVSALVLVPLYYPKEQPGAYLTRDYDVPSYPLIQPGPLYRADGTDYTWDQPDGKGSYWVTVGNEGDEDVTVAIHYGRTGVLRFTVPAGEIGTQLVDCARQGGTHRLTFHTASGLLEGLVAVEAPAQ